VYSSKAGWAIGANVPFETNRYDDVISRTFSILHNSIGVIFSSIAVLNIAKVLTESREQWIVQELDNIRMGEVAQNLGIWGQVLLVLNKNLYQVRTLGLLMAFVLLGALGSSALVDEWGLAEGFDFVLSTLTCAGYVVPPAGSAGWKYSLMGFYATTGVPLFNISMGEC
jgi:hypothetical protein